MALYPGDEILGRATGQRRVTEAGVVGKITARLRVHIGEVTAPTPGDTDFLANLVIVFEERHAPAPFGSLQGAKQSGGTGTNDNSIITQRRGGHRIFQGWASLCPAVRG